MSETIERTMTARDMQPFCGQEEIRPYLWKPFSFGEYTYATNGHIGIRIPRLEDVPELDGGPESFPAKAESLFQSFTTGDFKRVDVKFPEPESGRCRCCDGRGKEHDCPDCECICEECDGTGRVETNVSYEFDGVLFDVKYLRLITALPNPELSAVDKDTPAAFRFNGGDGVLMPLQRRYPRHMLPSGEVIDA